MKKFLTSLAEGLVFVALIVLVQFGMVSYGFDFLAAYIAALSVAFVCVVFYFYRQRSGKIVLSRLEEQERPSVESLMLLLDDLVDRKAWQKKRESINKSSIKPYSHLDSDEQIMKTEEYELRARITGAFDYLSKQNGKSITADSNLRMQIACMVLYHKFLLDRMIEQNIIVMEEINSNNE